MHVMPAPRKAHDNVTHAYLSAYQAGLHARRLAGNASRPPVIYQERQQPELGSSGIDQTMAYRVG